MCIERDRFSIWKNYNHREVSLEDGVWSPGRLVWPLTAAPDGVSFESAQNLWNTSAKVLFGREIRLPCDLAFGRKPDEKTVGEYYINNFQKRMCDIHEEVCSHIQTVSDRMKQYYDIRAQVGEYRKGDLVWLHNFQRKKRFSVKLQQNWDRPYRVMKSSKDPAYRNRKKTNRKPQVVHFDRSAPCASSNYVDVQAMCFQKTLRSLWLLTPTVAKTALEYLKNIGRTCSIHLLVGLYHRWRATRQSETRVSTSAKEAREPRIGEVMAVRKENHYVFPMMTKLWTS